MQISKGGTGYPIVFKPYLGLLRHGHSLGDTHQLLCVFMFMKASIDFSVLHFTVFTCKDVLRLIGMQFEKGRGGVSV